MVNKSPNINSIHTKKYLWHIALKSPVLAWDSNKNVAGLNRITSVLVKDNMYMYIDSLISLPYI